MTAGKMMAGMSPPTLRLEKPRAPKRVPKKLEEEEGEEMEPAVSAEKKGTLPGSVLREEEEEEGETTSAGTVVR